MRILAANTPSSSYLFVLLASVIYWLRFDAGAKKDFLPRDLMPRWKSAVAEGEEFCKKYRMPIRPYRAYTTWIASNGPDTEDELVTILNDHLKTLRQALPLIKKNHEVTDLELATINRIRLWHGSENEATLEAIRSAVGKLDVPQNLVKYFSTEIPDASPLVAALRKLVKTLTGQAALYVPLEDQARFRDKYPDQWTEYLRLRRELSLITKQELREYVRNKGGKASIDEARKHLESKGVPHRLPKGFSGLVGEDGALLTKQGSPLKTGTGGDVTSIDPAAKIVMNPNYDASKDNVAGRTGNWVFKTILPTKDASGKNNEQYFYTGDKLSLNRAHKFDVVDKLIAKETKMVAAWRRDLLGRDLESSILAAQCELVYETCARVGGRDSSNKNGQTFGLTTLLVGNVKSRGNTRVLDYVGKDSAQQRHILKPETPFMRKVIKILDSLCEGKTRKDLLWSTDNQEFNANRLRMYFRRVSGVPEATPHKLRHLRGTRLAITELDLASAKLLKSRKLNQASVDTAFKAALTNVGRILGHVKGIGAGQTTVWTTAAKNYVSVSVMEEFYAAFKAAGIRPPSFLSKLR